jgi:hypothetical protein
VTSQADQAPATGFTADCASNSFTAGTPVLLADGSRKPIDEVQVGDQVLATDPVTGRTEAKPVVGLIVGEGRKNLVEITVDTGDPAGTIIATDGHPFWVDSENRWVDAKDLKPGFRLETADHRPATVVSVRTWTQVQVVYNLTVDDIHTYYVASADSATSASILVHNAGCNISRDSKGRFAVRDGEEGRAGSVGEDLGRAQLREEGEDIVGRQATTRNEAGRKREWDDAIRNPDGTLTPVEVKLNTGRGEAAQRDFDKAFNAGGKPLPGVGRDKGSVFVPPVRVVRVQIKKDE